MQQKTFLGQSPLGFHHIAYTEWGDATASPPVICVHGLTRNGRDFDPLAASLAKQRQVFCPDIVGRGRSDFLKDPTYYSYPQYSADMTALIARTARAHIDWVGTSMGGILGMMLASQPNAPIRRLVVNDVGPLIPLAALKRIGDYVGKPPTFADKANIETYMREVYAPFGQLTDADWRHLADHGARKLPDGQWTLAYDPGIGAAFQNLDKDIGFWALYDHITCPVLLIRGANSDLLPAAVAHEMTQRGPKAKLIEIKDTGHAPALMDPAQIAIVSDFLAAT